MADKPKRVDLTTSRREGEPESPPAPVAPPAGQGVPVSGMPGIKGTLPLPTGGALSVKSLTKAEREGLEAIGWKEGEPVPSDLADQLAVIKKEMEQEQIPLPIDPATPPLKMPEPVAITDLPAAQQRELAASIRATAETVKAAEGSRG